MDPRAANPDRVGPRELVTAARVADGLVYVAGLAGVVAGALLFREGDAAGALVAWVLTFIAGAALRVAAWASRALAQLLERTSGIEEDLAALRRQAVADERAADDPGRHPGDLRGPWGGWH